MMGNEHRCGPSREEVLDALARGETFGTWKRCPECAEREEALLRNVFILPSHTENDVDPFGTL